MDVEDVPSARRAELGALKSRIQRLYSLPVDSDPANASDVAQMLAEEDGDALPDTI